MYIEQHEQHGTIEMPPDDGCGSAAAHSRLLEHYESIARTSQRMLKAAQQADWDEVARHEERCRTLVAALKAADPHAPLAAADNRRRVELLRRMLADDAEIRDCDEPWMKQFEQFFAPSRGRV